MTPTGTGGRCGCRPRPDPRRAPGEPPKQSHRPVSGSAAVRECRLWESARRPAEPPAVERRRARPGRTPRRVLSMPATLRVGARGPDVVQLQQLLNAKQVPSPNLTTDGAFGPRTAIAVRTF